MSTEKTKNKDLPYSNPIWFSDISEGIRTLALKDQEVIYKNVKYNYFQQYIKFVQLNSLVGTDYSFLDYLSQHLNVKFPFGILHGVDFSGEPSMNFLTENDWENIADLVVRISLGHTLELEIKEMELLNLAQQYDWDCVQL